MKSNRTVFTGLGFVAGTLFGIMMVVTVSFTSGPSGASSAGGNVAVSATQAHGYVASYLAGATPLNQVVKGFVVDKTQLDAMNSISAENPALTSFRIYFGRDNNAASVAIVVGVDGSGKDAVANTIFSTDAPKSGPCPPSCDVSSPIAGGR